MGRYEWRVNGVLQSTATDLPILRRARQLYDHADAAPPTHSATARMKTIIIRAACPVPQALPIGHHSGCRAPPITFTIRPRAWMAMNGPSITAYRGDTGLISLILPPSAGNISSISCTIRRRPAARIFSDNVYFTCRCWPFHAFVGHHPADTPWTLPHGFRALRLSMESEWNGGGNRARKLNYSFRRPQLQCTANCQHGVCSIREDRGCICDGQMWNAGSCSGRIIMLLHFWTRPAITPGWRSITTAGWSAEHCSLDR